jgi:hypothetical protein
MPDEHQHTQRRRFIIIVAKNHAIKIVQYAITVI